MIEEYADLEHKRVITSELRAMIVKARHNYLRKKFPTLATDEQREIAESEDQWQAILRKAGR